jgi:putative tricarboxylic transport membrane protein
MKRGWQVFSASLLVLFLFGIWQSSKLSLFDKLGPGPGFFGFWLGILGAVLSCVLFLQSTRRTNVGLSDANVLPDRFARGRVLSVVGLLVFAALAFDPLGYRLTTLLFSAAMLFVLGVRSLAMVAGLSIIFSFGVFYVFYYWLKVPLPIGVFGV